MTPQEMEVALQEGHTFRAIKGYQYIFLAGANVHWQGYIIRKVSQGTQHERVLPYKTARVAVRKMLGYAPADKWEVVS